MTAHPGHETRLYVCGVHVMLQCRCIGGGMNRIVTGVPCPEPGCGSGPLKASNPVASGLTLGRLQQINVQRGKRWHNGNLREWNPLEWAGAMAGEAGEACNAAKKLRRVELSIANNDGRARAGAADYRWLVAKEAADTIIYALLLIEVVGHDAEAVLREVFNKKSDEYSFPERL